MALNGNRPVPVEQFGGLDLRTDPLELGWKGAVDVLNVDFAPGAMNTRDGYTQFTSAAAASVYGNLCPYYDAAGNTKLLALTGTTLQEIGTNGVVGATGSVGASPVTFARFGSPTVDAVYIASAQGVAPKKYTLAGGFTSPAYTGSPSARYVAITPWDNRLVCASTQTQLSRVLFSDAGSPETFGANSYVDLTPGDGEAITGMVTWREYLFVFKASRIFVFYGTSTDATGNPIFDYRVVDSPIDAQAITARLTMVAGTNGVYILGARGIYVTTGGTPELISDAIRPIFTGAIPPTYQGSQWIRTASAPPILHFWDDKLLIAICDNGTANNKVLVYDTLNRQWSVYDIPIRSMCSLRIGGVERLMFGKTTPNHIYQHYQGVSATDAGTAITSRYRSGLNAPGGAGAECTIRETEVTGIGTVGFAWSRDDGALGAPSNVTLGTTLPARGYHRVAKAGENLSWQVASVSGGAWQVNRVVPFVRDVRGGGEMTT